MPRRPPQPPTPAKMALLQRGLTQQQLAEAIGKDPTNVGAVINDRAAWAPLRREIAAYLGMAEVELWPAG